MMLLCIVLSHLPFDNSKRSDHYLQGYLISCVWSCYRYINSRNSSDVLVYVTSNDTTVLLPPYDDANAVTGTTKEPPPPYVSA